MSSTNSVNTSPVNQGDQEGLNALHQMGVHSVNLNNLFGSMNGAITTLYEQITQFSIEYGGMFLVIAGIVWLISWKLHFASAAMWAKRIVLGVFAGEVIIILLPQLFYSFVHFLDNL
ncbi:hypothetical protein [Alicyclobacillus fodiniaquatilis]|uniref:TrbC/VIRB2 family protein n=1 Tax=Alicyclobacillus fodiniaquatilis TaxID=1661150 RepID=A0ABW4JEY1_9BACL